MCECVFLCVSQWVSVNTTRAFLQCLKKPTEMHLIILHWYVLNKVKIQIVKSVEKFKNFKIHLYFVFESACCKTQVFGSSSFSQERRSLSKHESFVLKNIYPQCHSLSFGHLFYLMIFLLKTKVSKFNIPQTLHERC